MNPIPVIVDNGSFQCRAGFANCETPQLIFKNLVAKLRKERGKKDVDVQVGNEIENLDNVRFALKSQFDRNVVVHMDVQETIFDYLFLSLNLKDNDQIEHPIVLSEPFLNPNYCRNLMSELLFESYHIPSVAYGTDALFSFQKNFPSSQDGLIVSFGYHTIHILPLIDGKVDCGSSRRINIGGSEITSFLVKLMKLKYPAHTNFLSYVKIEDLLHSSGYVAQNYSQELENWMNLDFYNQHVIRLQLPAKSELSVNQAESLKERRKEIAKKMVEMNARKREEKLAEDEERLEILTEIKMMAEEDGDIEEIERALRAANVTSINELLKAISTLQSSIYRVKNRTSKPESAATVASGSTGEPNAKNSKDSTEDREKFDAYITNVRVKRTELLKKRAQRRQRRTDMAKRRTAAAQERMRILSQLARKEKHDKHDTFGMKDSDWDVYKSIQKDGGSDSEEKEEQDELNELEQVLKKHDPAFNELQVEAKGREDDHELHVGLEIVRAPELIFQPSMIGNVQGGLAETIEHILKLYPDNVQHKLVSNVFLTGGLASYSGILQRVEHQMLEMRPFESTFKVNCAENPVLDSWFGMRNFSMDPSNQVYFITRSEYEEKGGEYLKEHFCSNSFFTPHMNTNMDSTIIAGREDTQIMETPDIEENFMD